jgi:AcrR family transcriptional regulator
MKPVHPTRQRVLKNALQIASVQGIQGTTIGAVAKESKLSKSGLFCHFQSKEMMQIAILDTAEELFLENVISKAKKETPGLNRLRSLFTGWLGWTQRSGLAGGCPFVHAVSEYGALSESVQEKVIAVQKTLLETLGKQAYVAIKRGELTSDTDVEQLVFEMLGIYLGHHWNMRIGTIGSNDFRAIKAFERLLEPIIVHDDGRPTPELLPRILNA